MKTTILLILLVFSRSGYSQVTFTIDKYNCREKVFGIVPKSPIDTTRISKKNNSGNDLNKYFLNDSLWIDSLHRFYENGELAYRLQITDYTRLINRRWGTVNYMPNYYLTTYHENGIVRSHELLGYSIDRLGTSNNSYFFINKYFNDNSELIYSEVYLYGDTIEGTFYEGKDGSVNELAVYHNKMQIETWYIENANSRKPIIIKIVDHRSGNVIERKRKIKKKLKLTPLINIPCGARISNG